MTNDSRLDVRVPAQQRAELQRLAKETGVTVPGLIRLATQRLLNDRASLLQAAEDTHA